MEAPKAIPKPPLTAEGKRRRMKVLTDTCHEYVRLSMKEEKLLFRLSNLQPGSKDYESMKKRVEKILIQKEQLLATVDDLYEGLHLKFP